MIKEKLIQGGVWLSVFSILIMVSAVLIYIGFNNARNGIYTYLIIGLLGK